MSVHLLAAKARAGDSTNQEAAHQAERDQQHNRERDNSLALRPVQSSWHHRSNLRVLLLSARQHHSDVRTQLLCVIVIQTLDDGITSNFVTYLTQFTLSVACCRGHRTNEGSPQRTTTARWGHRSARKQ